MTGPVTGDSRHHARRRHRRAPRRGGAPGPEQMADAVADGDRRRPPPRRAGGDGHRQDAGLPRPRHRSGERGRGRHGDQGAAGPAGRPRTCRSSPRTWTTVRLGGAQGPQQLRVPAAPPRAAAAGGDGPARARGLAADTQSEISRIAEWVGRHSHRRRRRARLGAVGRGLAVGQRRQRRVPRRRPLPAGRAVLRRAGPAAGGGSRRGRRQHPPLRAPRRPAAA